MRKLIYLPIILALASVLIVPSSAFADDTHQCSKISTVGVIVPLSAGAVSSGFAVKNSVELSDEKNDKQNCVHFVFEDDQMIPKNTVTAVNKLISVDHIDGLIVYGTPTSLAVADQIDRQGIPMIALSILGKVVDGRTHIVKHWCTAEKLNAAVVAEVKRRGYKKVAVVSMINEAMLGLRDLYRGSDPAETVLDEEFARDNTDFGAIAAKIAAMKPDAVYVLLFPPQVAPFMKRLRGAGYRGEAFGVHNIEDPQEIKAAAGSMNGMWLANGDGTTGENYEQAYIARFGAAPALGGASGYDSAKLMIECLNTADPNQCLHLKKDFSGAFGVYDATGKNDFDFPAKIKVVVEDSVQLQK